MEEPPKHASARRRVRWFGAVVEHWRRWRARHRRTLRVLLVLSLGLSTLVLPSYVRALTLPNSPGWRLRSAEWARDHYMGSALDWSEWCWFMLRRGRLAQLPPVELSAFPAPHRVSIDMPPDVTQAAPDPVAVPFEHPLPGEGEWRAVGWVANDTPVLRCTTFRPDPEHPRVAVGAARFTPELTRFVLVPGTQDPGGDWLWHGSVPGRAQKRLVAAFNSGFRLLEAQGGMYVEGKVARPLVPEAASLVLDAAGSADIVAWHGGAEPTAPTTAVRQNLRLIVDGGKLATGLSRNSGSQWGFGRNQACHTWRSGLGISRDRALLYVAGDGLTLMTLAEALKLAGAERAMELDIHDVWSTFNVFQPASRGRGKPRATKLLPTMPRSAERYLTPDDRDFIAAFIR